MTTPAIRNILDEYRDVDITIIGSFVATQVLKHHPNVVKVHVDDTKKSNNRVKSTYNFAKSIGAFDIAINSSNNVTWRKL